MNRRIRRHIEAVEERLAAVEASQDARGLARLVRFHDAQTRNYQHERLIHLLVTLFFGALTALALTGLALYLAWCAQPDAWILGGLIALSAVLIGLEAAYIGHYYHLENNVQALYGLTERLHQASGVGDL
ncbi:MAG: hypothetical protein LBD77_03955 [Bifidobacteriaceae bacterium]|nr:hypothetical protein [Bifidobacteriaceae bacterium]